MLFFTSSAEIFFFVSVDRTSNVFAVFCHIRSCPSFFVSIARKIDSNDLFNLFLQLWTNKCPCATFQLVDLLLIYLNESENTSPWFGNAAACDLVQQCLGCDSSQVLQFGCTGHGHRNVRLQCRQCFHVFHVYSWFLNCLLIP